MSIQCHFIIPEIIKIIEDQIMSIHLNLSQNIQNGLETDKNEYYTYRQ